MFLKYHILSVLQLVHNMNQNFACKARVRWQHIGFKSLLIGISSLTCKYVGYLDGNKINMTSFRF